MPPQILTQRDLRIKKIAAYSSIAVALSLIGLKTFALIYTESLAIMSSLIDSSADLLASLVTFWAISFSCRPADISHRFGHGKAEALSALAQAAFIIGSGLFIIYDAFLRLLYPQPIIKTDIGIIIMIVSLLLSFMLICFQTYVAKKTNSQAIRADALHYLVDVATNLAILISLWVVQKWNIVWFDTLTAFVIAIYLLFNTQKIIKSALAMLMDKELNEDIRDTIIKCAMSASHVMGIHDLRTRDSGGIYIIELHLEYDGNLSLNEVHEYTCNVENKIKEIYPSSQVLIHQDPVGINEERLDELII
ncbi:MAG: cation diffusion facilitator family transporter [Alphaproteobacteria bacterium]|nr:cation diffusion facilitator family transporter [Alphaproteobacteria bacterium]